MSTAAVSHNRRSPRLTADNKSSKSRKRKRDPETGMLPPQNVIKVAEPGSSDEVLNQRKLHNLYDAYKAFIDARDRYYGLLSQTQNAIIKGADVQQGTYKVQYGVRLVRRPRYKQVVIDLKGEQYQQRVLENTAPHAHFRVKVE